MLIDNRNFCRRFGRTRRQNIIESDRNSMHYGLSVLDYCSTYSISNFVYISFVLQHSTSSCSSSRCLYFLHQFLLFYVLTLQMHHQIRSYSSSVANCFPMWLTHSHAHHLSQLFDTVVDYNKQMHVNQPTLFSNFLIDTTVNVSRLERKLILAVLID